MTDWKKVFPELGLLADRRVGNARLYTANIASPIYQELTAILVKLGPRMSGER